MVTAKQQINNDWFKDITHIYISHIDQDHWDIKTIKKINPKVKIIIPKIVFNKLIEKTLNDLRMNFVFEKNQDTSSTEEDQKSKVPEKTTKEKPKKKKK